VRVDALEMQPLYHVAMGGQHALVTTQQVRGWGWWGGVGGGSGVGAYAESHLPCMCAFTRTTLHGGRSCVPMSLVCCRVSVYVCAGPAGFMGSQRQWSARHRCHQ
jgi:hypothetical protein